MFRDVNEEVLKGDGDGLEKEEFERVIYHPFLEHEVAGEVEKSREEEADVELGTERPIGTPRELQNFVRNEPPQPREHLINASHSEYITGK